MPYTATELNNKIAGLPKDIQDALASIEINDTLDLIEQKFNLNIEQVGALSNTINAVLLGDLPPHLFVSNISESLRIPKETSAQIAQEANNRIFLQIRESLKKIHKIEEAGAPHAHDEPAEERGALLQSIESPEKIPMRARIVQVSTQIPAQKLPIATVPQAQTANSTPKTITPTEPTPIATQTKPLTATPAQPATPAVRQPGPDPYRELA